MHLFHNWEYLSHKSGEHFRHCKGCGKWQHECRFGVDAYWEAFSSPPSTISLVPTEQYHQQKQEAYTNGMWQRLKEQQ